MCRGIKAPTLLKQRNFRQNNRSDTILQQRAVYNNKKNNEFPLKICALYFFGTLYLKINQILNNS
jgi:hypothetical protein